MTDKELLLSKLYDDNIICYWINFQDIEVTNQQKVCIAYWDLNSEHFLLSYHWIWRDFEMKLGDNPQQINDLTSSILADHLKRKGIITKFC